MSRNSVKAIVRRLVCAALLVCAAFVVNHASTLGWGGAWGANDTRYKVSPVGISHVLQPRQVESPHVWAGWNPETGDAALRAVAPGGEGAFARLKLAYPLLQVAFWLALAGACVVLLPFRGLQSRVLIVTLAAGSACAVLAAVTLFITSAQRALAVLATVDFGYGGTLACMLVGVAPLFSVGALSLFLRRFRWLPFLGIFAFNLVVWYHVLVFLIPIAALLLYAASRLAERDTDGEANAKFHGHKEGVV